MIKSKLDDQVSELQGPYGPLQVLESRIQQIWAFQHLQIGKWHTHKGKLLRVESPGQWNRGAGPDFKEAVIELDGEKRVGDVEIHLYREDWWRHGHDIDPGYNNVVLHVVLFAGGLDRKIITSRGTEPDEWNLGPWMREDIESISGGSPGLFGELVPELKEWMESDLPVNIRERLKVGADRRWRDKESMARCLFDAHGVEGGMHRMCLYYMGFPFNRRQFFEMADTFPLSCWRSNEILGILHQRWMDTVRWRYGRPANRADCRLNQYIQLNREVPDWISRLTHPPGVLVSRLHGISPASPPVNGTSRIRKEAGLVDWNKWLRNEVFGSQLNNSLIKRLWVDVLLPMLSVAEKLTSEEAFQIWFHGLPATFPDSYRELFKLAFIQVDKDLPLCNGWVQGILWLEDQLRLERVRSSLGNQTECLDRSGA